MISKTIIFNSIFLPLILFIGCVTSYEDFLTSKIRNKWIMLGLAYAFVVYLISGFLFYLTKNHENCRFINEVVLYFFWHFDKWCINLIVSLLVAFFLWRFKHWSAGDAKLFIVYAALIPISKYSKGYFNYNFASFLLLFYIFIPPAIYFLIKAFVYFIKKLMIKKIRKEIPKTIKKKLYSKQKTEFLKVFFGLFCFFLFFRMLREELMLLTGNILVDQNLLMLISFFMFKPLSKFFKKNTKGLFIGFIILTFIIIFRTKGRVIDYLISLFNSFNRSIATIILITVFNTVISKYHQSGEAKRRKTTPFAFWMFLGALITWFI